MVKVKAKTSFMDTSTGFIQHGSIIEVDGDTIERIESLVEILEETIEVDEPNDGADNKVIDDLEDGSNSSIDDEQVVATKEGVEEKIEAPKPKRGRKPKAKTDNIPPVEA